MIAASVLTGDVVSQADRVPATPGSASPMRSSPSPSRRRERLLLTDRHCRGGIELFGRLGQHLVVHQRGAQGLAQRGVVVGEAGEERGRDDDGDGSLDRSGQFGDGGQLTAPGRQLGLLRGGAGIGDCREQREVDWARRWPPSRGSRSMSVRCSATTTSSTTICTAVGYNPGRRIVRAAATLVSAVVGTSTCSVVKSSATRRDGPSATVRLSTTLPASPSTNAASSPRSSTGRYTTTRRSASAAGAADAGVVAVVLPGVLPVVAVGGSRSATVPSTLKLACHGWPGWTANRWSSSVRETAPSFGGAARAAAAGAAIASAASPRTAGRRALIGRVEVELHDEELVGQAPEAERLVEGQRRCVGDGGVDDALGQSSTTHPRQRVEDEGAAMSGPLLVRDDSEPLQVALPRRGARDGERDEPPSRRRPTWCRQPDEPGAGMVQRRGVAHLGQVAGVVAPRVAEGGAVDVGRLSMVTRAQVGRASWYRRGAILEVAPGEIDAQQRQPVDDMEPGVDEPCRGVGEERAGPNGAQLGGGVDQRVDPALQLVRMRHDRLVGEGEVNDVVVEGPRSHPDPRAEAGGSNLHRSLTVVGEGAVQAAP